LAKSLEIFSFRGHGRASNDIELEQKKVAPVEDT